MWIWNGADDPGGYLARDFGDFPQLFRPALAIGISGHYHKIWKSSVPSLQVTEVLTQLSNHHAMTTPDVLPSQFDFDAVLSFQPMDEGLEKFIMGLILDKQGDLMHRSRPLTSVPRRSGLLRPPAPVQCPFAALGHLKW